MRRSLEMAGSRADFLLTAYTTAMLSQWAQILLLPHWGPHMATASTIGTSSFGAIDTGAHSGGHWSCFQRLLNMAPQPHLPDASEVIA